MMITLIVVSIIILIGTAGADSWSYNSSITRK